MNVPPIQEYMNQRRLSLMFMVGVIVLSTIVYVWNLNALPLADYDEASHAQITQEMLASGDIFTTRLLGKPQFVKPPLYYWTAMLSTRFFGVEDFAYRLPSIFFAIVSIVLVWLIVKQVSHDTLSATLASLILLASPIYFIAARQVRLDIPAISMVLLALYAALRGWEKPRWLLVIAPAIALGFLFKSFLALLAVPLIVVFCLFYKKFEWIKSKFFWLGIVVALIIFAPWHIYETLQWGWSFWDQYLFHEVFARYFSGISDVGSNDTLNLFHLPQLLLHYGQPWIYIFIVGSPLVLYMMRKDPIILQRRLIAAATVSAVLTIIVFSFSRTQILTYVLLAFPFMAIASAIVVISIFTRIQGMIGRCFVVLALAILFIYATLTSTGTLGILLSIMHPEFVEDEKNMGLIVQQHPDKSNLYVLAWPFHETLRYYSKGDLTDIPYPPSGITLKGPWFLIFTTDHLAYFRDENKIPKKEYENLPAPYHNNGFYMLYSDSDFMFPEKE